MCFSMIIKHDLHIGTSYTLFVFFMLKDIITQTTTAIESLNMSAVLQMTYIYAR